MLLPEQIQRLLHYNSTSGKLYWKFREDRDKSWNTRYAYKEAFTTIDAHGYLVGKINYKCYKAHRVAWALFHSSWPTEVIDHINRIKTDNRIDNLRDTNKSVNTLNAKLSSNNTTGIKGISYDRTRDRYVVYTTVHRKRKYLGFPKTFDEAIRIKENHE